ncbi:hypothetical protein ABZ567_31160 [Streptomyces sp. NPDC016459]|uniref:hypothetical protein n=1 Tax=Streptomyces sp. NPDC016459 TaxID=3157190 RepID=UPI0034037718
MPVPDARVELQIQGAWTDVTQHVVQATGIQLDYGRTDEGRPVEPGTGALTLLSPNGVYSNRNPNSPYFGKLPRNTPIRVSTTAGETYMRVNDAVEDRASTPHHASFNITGDLDVRFDGALDDWRPDNSTFLMGKWAAAPNATWYLYVNVLGLSLAWSPDGTAFVQRTSAPLPAGPGRRLAVRATLDVNNGSGGHTVTFYTAPTLAGPWTQLGPAQVTTGTTSIATNTADLQVGDISGFNFLAPVGEVYAAEVRNGIGGTVVAAPRFDQQNAGATGFTDSAGRVWTLRDHATITDRRTRVVHVVPSWPSTWHRSGGDVRAPIETAGVLRRLGQGRKAIDSALRRRIITWDPPVAYWPCEDGSSATQAAAPIKGVRPLAFTKASFASDDTLAGSAMLPAVDAGGTMTGSVPIPSGPPDYEWSVHLFYRVDSAPVSDAEIFAWRTNGSLVRWRVLMRAGQATLQAFDFENTMLLEATMGAPPEVFSGWQRITVRVEQPGGGNTINWNIGWYNSLGTYSYTSGTSINSAGAVTQIATVFGAFPGLRVGHVVVLRDGGVNSTVFPFMGAETGWIGETAVDRLRRLAVEERTNVTLSAWQGNGAQDAEAMGAQRPGVLLDVLQECADSDGGILAEEPNSLGLVYRDRTSLEIQSPVVIPYAALTTPFSPVEDDLRLRNDVTVERVGGSSARAVQGTGPLSVAAVGQYDEAVPLSLATDGRTEQIAAWRLHVGTWDEARYPQVRIMLHRHPELIPAVSRLRVGDYIQITGTPSHMPPGPVALLVQRISENLRTHTWDVVLTCSPAGPWRVGIYDSATRGKADTSGSQLASGVSSTATSLSVTTTVGVRWTVDPAEMPIDITVGGEEMRVTAITGTGLTQTFTVVRSANGVTKSHAAGAAVSLARPAYYAL